MLQNKPTLSVLKTVNALNLSVDIVDLKKVLSLLTQEKDLSQVYGETLNVIAIFKTSTVIGKPTSNPWRQDRKGISA